LLDARVVGEIVIARAAADEPGVQGEADDEHPEPQDGGEEDAVGGSCHGALLSVRWRGERVELGHGSSLPARVRVGGGKRRRRRETLRLAGASTE
jgi:hypothetical protein